MTFLDTLEKQRWDDHRYYHHSRINQSLHLFSAFCFIAAYVLVFVEPAAAVLIGWLLAMPSRQIGHFFFEPKGYDEANQATHEHKEAIKVGYNLRRKVILMTAWVASPLLLAADATAGGLLPQPASWFDIVRNISVLWLVIGVAAVAGRTVQLCIVQDVETGLVWCTKILTDPFHDVLLYRKAPVYVLRGELFDPIVPHVPAQSVEAMPASQAARPASLEEPVY